MPLNFPTGPSLNQLYIFNGIRWRWNGYAWSSSGICGANGAGFTGNYVMGITGGIGITVSGPDGIVEVSIRLDEPDIGTRYSTSQHIAPTIFSGDTGPARKVAFLQEDGSVSFDYIKNYDVFRKSEFQFDILSYDIPGLSPQLAGAPDSNFQLNTYIANMTYNQAASAGTIKVTNATFFEQTGFPAAIETLGLATFEFNVNYTLKYKSLTYQNVDINSDFYTIQIGITGTNTDGAQVYKTKDYNLYFYNHIFYGQSQQTSITTLPSSPPLTAVLNGSRTFTINTTIEQDNAIPYYLYYAYPTRFGSAIFRDNATNIEGGFQQQQDGVEYTNARGYSELYSVWRSEQGNLGAVSISVT